MRISALVKSHNHVCCRYRIAALRPFLEAAGHHLEIHPWSSGWLLQQMVPFLNQADALIVQRKLLPSWQLHLIRRRVRWLIYDFDDAIFLHSSFNVRGQDCPQRYARFKQMLAAADIVVGGNAFLAENAGMLTEPAKVQQIPTCVDANRYTLAKHPPRGLVKLAWIGSSSTLRALERTRGLLERIGRAVPKVTLKVICDRSLQLEGMPVEFRPWSEPTEAVELADADIGISWLPDDRWTEGKCGLKVLQYMAAGLPVVASPVGIHRTLVRHGETGLLAETPEQWTEAIRSLAGNPALRRRMGQAGRRLVEGGYDIAHGAAGWQGVLQRLESANVCKEARTG